MSHDIGDSSISALVPTDLPDDTSVTTLTKVHYKVDGQRGLQQVLVIVDDNTITVTDLQGEILIEHTRPAPGVTYVGNGQPSPRQVRQSALSNPAANAPRARKCHRSPET